MYVKCPTVYFFMLQRKDYSKKIGTAAVWTGIILCVIIIGIIILFLICGVAIVANFPLCDALYFGTEEPHTIVLPDFRNLSSSELSSLLAGTYKISSKYRLQLKEDPLHIIKLCIRKRQFTKVSACMDIGTNLEGLEMWICSPDTRPDCLPSAIVDHWFGVSLWFQERFIVAYAIMDIDSSAISGRHVTNTTTMLSDVWYDLFGCQVFTNLTIAVIFFGSLIIICCLGCAGWCLRFCCKVKWWGHTPYYAYMYSIYHIFLWGTIDLYQIVLFLYTYIAVRRLSATDSWGGRNKMMKLPWLIMK